MLNQVSYTFIMLQEAVFWNLILKFIFLFWIKMAFDYSKQPSLKKIKALILVIQLWKSCFLCWFSLFPLVAAKMFLFHTQKPTGWEKTSLLILTICFFKGELQLPLLWILRSNPELHDSWLQAATLTIP